MTTTIKGNTKKEKLLNLLKTCGARYITLSIVNPDMLHSEYVTVFNPDFEFKAEVIDRDYNDDLELYRNNNVKIDSVLGTMFLEEEAHIQPQKH